MLNAIVASFALGVAGDVSPALLISRASFEAIWAQAIEDGRKRRDPRKGFSKAERVIDRYRVSITAKEPCSWATFVHPRLLIRWTAYQAGSQYWADEQIAQAKQDMMQLVDVDPKAVVFFVELREMPSFAGGYGRLNRYANPSNLTDVRCVLKVGDRIIQPATQPGDLTLSRSDNLNIFSTPQNTYVSGRSSAYATVYGPGGTATGTAQSNSSYVIQSWSTGEENYSTYRGQFVASFPLRDEKGQANIGPNDKEIKLLIIKKSAELTATYKLGDWLKALEK